MSDEVSQIEVLNDCVIVRGEDAEKDVGGIVRPDTADEVAVVGEVVGVGEDVDKNIKLNDRILFRKKGSFRKIELDRKEYIALKKNEVLAVMFGDEIKDISPVRDMVFLEWEFAAAFYGGTGILRPDSYKEMSHTGLVLAAGPDCKSAKTGDRVQFDQFSSIEKLQEGTKRYTIVSEKNLYLVLPKRDVEKEKESDLVYSGKVAKSVWQEVE